MPRRIGGCRRDAYTHTDAGAHSSVGQFHLDAPRLASDPANVHSPCSHDGGLSLPALTAGVWCSAPFPATCGRHTALHGVTIKEPWVWQDQLDCVTPVQKGFAKLSQ